MDALAVFARNVRDARANADMSQRDVAEAIGMDVAQFGKIERGEVDPGVRTVARIAKGLSLPAARLFEGV